MPLIQWPAVYRQLSLRPKPPPHESRRAGMSQKEQLPRWPQCCYIVSPSNKNRQGRINIKKYNFIVPSSVYHGLVATQPAIGNNGSRYGHDIRPDDYRIDDVRCSSLMQAQCSRNHTTRCILQVILCMYSQSNNVVDGEVTTHV